MKPTTPSRIRQRQRQRQQQQQQQQQHNHNSAVNANANAAVSAADTITTDNGGVGGTSTSTSTATGTGTGTVYSHHNNNNNINNNNATPTASRARKNGRRLQVWMKQQWRQRNIPTADFYFDNNNNNNFNNSSNNAAADDIAAAAAAAAATILSSSSSPASQRKMNNIKTPTSSRNRSSSNININTARARATPKTFQNFETFQISTPSPSSKTNITTTSPGGTVVVSNVDQALEALTSQYKFETQFPIIRYNSNDDDNEYDDNIVDNSNYDWILDGHEEWNQNDEKNQKYTAELMRQMYPNNNNNNNSNSNSNSLIIKNNMKMTTDDVERGEGSNAINNDDVIDDDDDDDETNLMILKFGSVMGQQEYQFASFDDNHSAFVNVNNNNVNNVNNDVNNDVNNVNNSATTTTITTTTEAAPPNTDADADADADTVTTEIISIIETKTATSKEEKEEDNNNKIIGNDDDDDDDNSEQQQQMQIQQQQQRQQHQHQNEIKKKRDTNNTDQEVVIEKEEEKQKQKRNNDVNDVNDVNDITISSSSVVEEEEEQEQEQDQQQHEQQRHLPNNNNNNNNNNNKGSTSTSITTAVAVAEEALSSSPRSSPPHHDDNNNEKQNFETFWQDAIDAPTPDTGTFPSIDSRSTYVTSPIINFPTLCSSSSSPSLFQQQQQQQQQQQDQDVSFLSSPPPSNNSTNNNSSTADDDENDDENDDFCDFQTADKNSSFETAPSNRDDETTADNIIRATPNDIINSNMHTGITPLKKNGRGDGNCQTPTIASTVDDDVDDDVDFDVDIDVVRSSLFSSNSSNDDHDEGLLTPRPSPPPPSSSTNINEENNEHQQQQSASNRDGFVARSLAGTGGSAEQPTPVIRNYQYIIPSDINNYNNNNNNNNNVLLSKSTHDDDIDNTRTTPPPSSGGGRRMMVVPKTIMGTPERFRLDDINNVMNGVVADDDDQHRHHRDDLAKEEEEEEEETETSKVSLWAEDESTCNQSSSIPSVVQLFTKSIKTDQSKTSIVVPNTVRATTATATTTTATGLSIPSFYSGKNSFLYDNYNPSLVASASASLMSMKMMMSENNASLGGGGGGGGDEPSITSSLASPEGKFFRRRSSQSKLFRQKQKRQLEYQRRRSSNDNDNDDDDEFTYEEDEDSDDDEYDDEDSDEFDDEESLSLGSLSTLPNQYWKHPDLDHTLQELMKLEWEWLPYWQMKQLVNFDNDDDDANCCNTDNVPLLQEQITDRLSSLDAFYGKICKKVYKKIQPHAEQLVKANEAALELQKNLQLSQMNLIKSQKSIELAKCGRIDCNDENDDDNANTDDEGVGIYGAIRLLDLWDTQESYLELNKTEMLISEICDLEFRITQLIENFDTYKSDSLEECDVILSLVQELHTQLQDEPVNRLVCFDDARERTAKFVSETFLCRLHVCLADIAVEWCHSSDSSSSSALFISDNTNAYSRLIQTMICVNNHHHRDQYSSTEIDKINPTLISDICTSIQTALLLEAQKAFGRSLLDPTDSENEKSDYEQELVALSNNENYLDSMRLPIWTHNLVTIRFEFEMKQGQKTPLPAVFHKLCLLLTNVLCGMYHLIEWHSKKEEASSSNISEIFLLEIREQLQTRRASIWNSCIQSMEECLEEYLKCSAGKKSLFSLKENNEHDDSKWREDLEGIHDVSILMNQFLSLSPTFLDGISKDVVNDGSMIEEKILSCSKTHLRSFHVDAMNTLGMMLYREDWQLHSLNKLETKNTTRIQDAGDGTSKNSPEYIIKCISGQLFHQGDDRSTQNCRSRCNMFSSMTDGNILAENRNPFEIDRERIEVVNVRHSEPIAPFDLTDDNIATILQLLRNCIGDDDARSSNIMLRCIFCGILPWTARLLIMIDRLPILVEEACEVLINIFDLYATTAFRLCSGNASNERILLGIDDTFQKHVQNDDYSAVARDNRSASPMFDFGLRSKPSQASTRYTPVISATAEAELCTLVPEEHNDLDCLREFLIDSQKRLQGVAKLDLVDNWISDPTLGDETIEEEFAQETARVLEKRQAASCNHIFLAIGLYIATKSMSTSCEKIISYTDRVIQSFPLLMSLCNRISCMRSIRGKALLTEIVTVGSVWEESKLHEQSNDYVEDFCGFLALIWYYLYTCSGSRLPIGILKNLWENLVGGGYMVLLDGFSKVPYCSTEGRSLMSMDVATYNAGVSARSIASRLEDQPRCPLPDNIQPYRTMSYVNTYIKLFYFPPNDALGWIKSNFKLYHQHHVLALVINARDAKNLTEQVMDCYRGKKNANTIRI